MLLARATESGSANNPTENMRSYISAGNLRGLETRLLKSVNTDSS
eukprot:gene4162-4856_t